MPQSYDWGVEAQVDWYEAHADMAGERTKLQVFSMRSMASGAAFHCAFLHATQQAFLEAHELAFAYYDGVFQKLRYDNLSLAVKKMPAGTPACKRPAGSSRPVPTGAHESEFCTPGKATRKRGVEARKGAITSSKPLGLASGGGWT